MTLLLNIEVSRDSDDGLRIKMVNHSERLITLYQHQLPWQSWQSLVLVVVKADPGGTVLAQTRPVDDPGPSTVDIAPGQTLEGSVDLAKRCPEFSAALRNRDVVVFWSYQVQPVQGALTPRSTGYVVFERKPAEVGTR